MTNLFGKICHALATLHGIQYSDSLVLRLAGHIICVPVDICRYFTSGYVLRQRRLHEKLLIGRKGKWRWEAA